MKNGLKIYLNEVFNDLKIDKEKTTDCSLLNLKFVLNLNNYLISFLDLSNLIIFHKLAQIFKHDKIPLLLLNFNCFGCVLRQ